MSAMIHRSIEVIAQTMKVIRSRSCLCSSLMWRTAPHRTACNALSSAPLYGCHPTRPSVFICPMVGSIALRRLIIARSVRLIGGMAHMPG